MELPAKLEEYKGGLIEIVHPGGDIEYGEIVDMSQCKEKGVTLTLKYRVKQCRKGVVDTWIQVDTAEVTIDSSYKDMSIGQGRRFFMSALNSQKQYTLFQPEDKPPNFPNEHIPPQNKQR